MALSDLCSQAVSVTRKTWESGPGAVRTATPTTVTLKASVHPMRPTRVEAYGMTAGQTGFTLYFAADPNVNADDSILWGTRRLSVLGKARDMAGRYRAWGVDCVEHA
jgi:hypothetical protein